jgi:hypothetical protein
MTLRPYWERPLDVVKLLTAIVLAILLLTVPQQCRSAPATVSAPVFSQPADGAELQSGHPLVLEGQADPGARIAVYDGDRLVGETTAGDDGRWRLELTKGLRAGGRQVRAAVVGGEGQEVASSRALSLSVVEPAVPTVAPPAPPVVTMPLPGSTWLASEFLSFEGAAVPGSHIAVFDIQVLLGTATADAQGRWRLDLGEPPATGKHTVHAVASNAAGVESAASAPLAFEIIPDIAAPSIDEPAQGDTLTAGGMMRGTADPRATLLLYDGDVLLGETPVGADGAWEFSLPGDWSLGEHRLRVVAVDAEGIARAESPTLRVFVARPEPTGPHLEK